MGGGAEWMETIGTFPSKIICRANCARLGLIGLNCVTASNDLFPAKTHGLIRFNR